MPGQLLLRPIIGLSVWLLAVVSVAVRAEFDHSHATWDRLLAKHVVPIGDGHASQVRYAALRTERGALKGYLDSLSAVTAVEYQAWSTPQQLAFLINAYNGFTVELILTRYPDLESIKDLGSLLQSPWKKKFFTLLGVERHLDSIEHDLIRAPGVFDDPRIHAAVVCASIGCPKLRKEAFTAARIDVQLEDGMRRFLSDRSRNRFDAGSGTLLVSQIFDWYGDDFRKGHKGFGSLDATFSRYAEQLADTPEARARIRQGGLEVKFLPYDWKLNDAR